MEMERRDLDLKGKGFTLIEIMIALTVFSIGILGITGMLVIGEKGVAEGIRSFAAVEGAKGQMEVLRAALTPDTRSDTCSTISNPAVQCTWEVKRGVPADSLSTLQVISAWREGDRRRELLLKTVRFDGDE